MPRLNSGIRFIDRVIRDNLKRATRLYLHFLYLFVPHSRRNLLSVRGSSVGCCLSLALSVWYRDRHGEKGERTTYSAFIIASHFTALNIDTFRGGHSFFSCFLFLVPRLDQELLTNRTPLKQTRDDATRAESGPLKDDMIHHLFYLKHTHTHIHLILIII